MTRTTRNLHAFDLRSVLLFTSLTWGGTAAVMAQAPNPATQPSAPATNSAPAASQTQQTPAAIFLRTDVDGDGQISREEAQMLPSVAQQFDAWDRDGNGQLSQEEFFLGAKRYE